MMEDVIRHGTGMRANIGRPAAGKTGTSNEYKDAWFVGYTPDLAAGVWVGFDDMRRSLGSGEVGGRAAAPVWQRFMRSVLRSETAPDFMVPQGIVQARIYTLTGSPVEFFASDSSTINEYFKEGTVPDGDSGRPSLLRQISPFSSEQKTFGETKKSGGARILDPVQD